MIYTASYIIHFRTVDNFIADIKYNLRVNSITIIDFFIKEKLALAVILNSNFFKNQKIWKL